MSERTRELSIRKPYFDLIAARIKTVEVRVGYPSMRKIQPGQELVFVSGPDRLHTRAIRVTEYASFEEMLNHEDPVTIGGSLGEDPDKLLATIRSIYPSEKEKLGVLAIEIERTAP